VNTTMNLQVLYNIGNFLSSRTTGGFSRRAQLHVVSLHKLNVISKSREKYECMR
jgi:hypothetical protein